MMIFSAILLVLSPTAPRSYEACTELVSEAPEAGLDYAEAWQAEGGGRPARHCLAVALLNTDHPGSAGAILAGLGDEESEEDPGVAARLYLQAAEAFITAGKREETFVALKHAYEAAPDTPEVHMSAAMIYATAEEWEGVILTLDALERYAALSSDGLALRGRAKFKLERYAEAAKDAAAALKLDAYLVDAVVLRGDLLNQGVKLPDDPFAAQ